MEVSPNLRPLYGNLDPSSIFLIFYYGLPLYNIEVGYRGL